MRSSIGQARSRKGRRELGPRGPGILRTARAALGVAAAASALGCHIEAAPDVPRPAITRSVVLPYVRAEGPVDPEACGRLCRPPVEGEEMTSCHNASLDESLVKHRRALGEKDVFVGCVVCTYAKKGASR